MSNFESFLAQASQFGGDQATFAELYRQLLDDSLVQGALAIHLHFVSNELRVRY